MQMSMNENWEIRHDPCYSGQAAFVLQETAVGCEIHVAWADDPPSKPMSNGKAMPSSLKDKIMASVKFQIESDEESQRHG